jgi:hypothetical protein
MAGNLARVGVIDRSVECPLQRIALQVKILLCCRKPRVPDPHCSTLLLQKKKDRRRVSKWIFWDQSATERSSGEENGRLDYRRLASLTRHRADPFNNLKTTIRGIDGGSSPMSTFRFIRRFALDCCDRSRAGTHSQSERFSGDRSLGIHQLQEERPSPIGHRTTLSRAYVEIGPPPTSYVALVRLWIERAVFWTCPCLLAWTLAVLARAVLSPPRPRFKLLRQPGIMAGVACLTAFCVAALESPAMLMTWWPRTAPPTFHWEDWWLFTWFNLPRTAGYSVALTWLVLILSGCWAANREWLDRLGRFLGLCWIGLALLIVSGACLMTIE